MGDAADDAFDYAWNEWIDSALANPGRKNVLWKRRQLGMPYRNVDDDDYDGGYSSDYVVVECVYKTKTDKAVLISQFNQEIWVPRSLLSWKSDNAIDRLERGDTWKMNVKGWFADKNQLAFEGSDRGEIPF